MASKANRFFAFILGMILILFFVGIVILGGVSSPASVMAYPPPVTDTPAPTETRVIYTQAPPFPGFVPDVTPIPVYFPVMIGRPQTKGITSGYGFETTDVALFGADWYYNYTSALYNPVNSQIVPMTWAGSLSGATLPASFNGYIIFLNEPEFPSQSNKSPAAGVTLYKNLIAAYPQARIVVGNSQVWGFRDTNTHSSLPVPRNCNNWIEAFSTALAATNTPLSTKIPTPAYYGVHLYNEVNNVSTWTCDIMNGDPNQYLARMDTLATRVPGIYWITEFGDPNANTNNDQTLLNGFKNRPYVARWSYFNARIKGNETWFPAGWNRAMSLNYWNTSTLQWQGLNPVGSWFATQSP